MASGACAAEALEALLHTRLPPLPAALFASFNSLQTRVSQNQDLCDTCKLAVFEAAAILGNVVSQHCAWLWCRGLLANNSQRQLLTRQWQRRKRKSKF